MANTVLFDDGRHKNVHLKDFGLGGLALQAEHHVIIHGRSGMILDPGGHKVYSKVLTQTRSAGGGGRATNRLVRDRDGSHPPSCRDTRTRRSRRQHHDCHTG